MVFGVSRVAAWAGWRSPRTIVDMGNSGTGARLLLGILAGHAATSCSSPATHLCGLGPMRAGRRAADADGSGAGDAREGGRLPLTVIRGTTELLPLDYTSPVASAQVKSAVLLAGLHAAGRTRVVEPLASRDHTERMLASMGAVVSCGELPDGRYEATIEGGAELHGQTLEVPADPSSAAFPMAAAALRGDLVRLSGVSLNPLRTGFLTTLREMGASIQIENQREVAGEPVGDLLVRGGSLSGVDVPAERAPSMIDEYPILAVVASRARGRTTMRGLAELRVKETDRLTVMAEGLTACGVRVEVNGDDLSVVGGDRTREAVIDACLDHRIAMSFLVLGGLADSAITVRGAEAIETSFPGFARLMNELGADIREGAPT